MTSLLRADDIDDVVQLLVKDALGRWRHRDNVKLEQQRDCVVFQLNELVHRLAEQERIANVSMELVIFSNVVCR